MALDYPVLEIDADFGDGSGTRTGVFVLQGNVEVSPELNQAYLLDNAGTTINAIFGGYLDPTSGTTRRRGIFIDGGGGSHIYEISFTGWEGSSQQWGDTNTTTLSEHDATGANALAQMQILVNYLRHTTTDSVNPGRLYVGEYADGTHASAAGVFNAPLDVALRGPQQTRTAERSMEFTGTITAVEVEDLDSVQDAADRLGF